SVGTATKSNIISIAVEMESPDLARNVLSKIIDIYLDMHINVHRTSGSYQFFDQQKEELKRELLESENALKNLKNSTGISALGEQRQILLDRAGNLQRELEKTESDIAASAASIKSLQEKLAKTPVTLVTVETSGFPNSATDELQKRLNELKLKEQDLLSTFTEESIPVKEIRRQIGEVTSMLQNTNEIRQVTTGLNETHQEIRLILAKEEGSLLSLQAKAGSLKNQLAKSRDELKTLNENEVLFTKLQREMEINESNYRKYSGSLEQSRIDQELEMGKISNISVVQKSSSAIKPVRPKKLLNLSLAILIGLFGGLAWAFTSERMDHSLKKPEDVHGKLQLPLFAVLPQLPAERLQSIGAPYEPMQSIPSSRNINTNSDLPVPIDNIGCCESFGKSLLQAPGSQPKSLGAIAVTSCHSGEGVSTIVSYIAKLLSEQSEGRVLIVDANSDGHRQLETGKNPAKAQISPPDKDRHNASNIKKSRFENVDLLTPRE
ncbi:MAG: GNVR domain-containing protein, partial [Desulfatirhabdiaceae bacterium]